MGIFLSKTWSALMSKRDVRILMVGLDAAGKTTILYKLKLGEIVRRRHMAELRPCADTFPLPP